MRMAVRMSVDLDRVDVGLRGKFSIVLVLRRRKRTILSTGLIVSKEIAIRGRLPDMIAIGTREGVARLHRSRRQAGAGEGVAVTMMASCRVASAAHGKRIARSHWRIAMLFFSWCGRGEDAATLERTLSCHLGVRAPGGCRCCASEQTSATTSSVASSSCEWIKVG